MTVWVVETGVYFEGNCVHSICANKDKAIENAKEYVKTLEGKWTEADTISLHWESAHDHYVNIFEMKVEG